MIALGIETSGRVGGAALLEAAGPGAAPRVLAECRIAERLRHGEGLLGAIAACFAEAGLGREALGLVVAGTGPGSYTGLRVGLAHARALAFAHELPLLGVPSFDAMAEALPAELWRKVAAVLLARNAYQGYVYGALYRPAGERLEREGEIWVRPAEAALPARVRPLLVVGDAPEEYPQVFRDPQVVAAPAEYAHAPPAALAACGLRAWFAGVRQRPESVLPLYLRPPLGV